MTNSKIIDVVTYNGEADLFDIRYNILRDYVDQFIVVEFGESFSGRPKEMQFPIDKYSDVAYSFFTQKDYSKYRGLAKSSPNTVGAEHWKTEFMQKESIKDCLTHLQDEDIVFISDCDEVWNPADADDRVYGAVHKLPQIVYTYWLNNRSSEPWHGTIKARYKTIRDKCLNHLRSKDHLKQNLSPDGWHFTSLHDQMRRKLEDSYTKETYANDWVMSHLDENIKQNKDFLGRSFTYKTDESDWPQYLKDNRHLYKHLLK
jgi:hypothetical protein